ncbi:MAG: hypothetical protein KDK00_09535 [Rhodobacteraceae bacterium]|nr:hypothetical protein [Paracoccaceae bacterium]
MSRNQFIALIVTVVIMAGATVGLAALLAPQNDFQSALPYAAIAGLAAALLVRWLIRRQQ